jgi:hypothetical protein
MTLTSSAGFDPAHSIRGRGVGGIALVLAFGLSALAAVTLSPRNMWVILGLVVTYIQVVALRACSGERLPLAAVLLVPLNIVGILGCAYYDDVASEAIVSFVLPRRTRCTRRRKRCSSSLAFRSSALV